MACKYFDKCESPIKKGLKSCTDLNCDVYCKRFVDYFIAETNMNKEARSGNNPYWDNICSIADRQRKKGIQTYGQGLEQNTMNIQERLTYLEEELVDALMYIEWCKDYLSNQK